LCRPRCKWSVVSEGSPKPRDERSESRGCCTASPGHIDI
jgi:hypothetical protein